MADYGNRWEDVKSFDEKYLQKLINHEQSREKNSENDLSFRSEQMACFEHRDSDSTIKTSLKKFDEHLNSLQEDLKAAEREEEAARKVTDISF